MATETLTAESLAQKFTPDESQKVNAGLAANQAMTTAMTWDRWMDIGEGVRSVYLATQREVGGPDSKSKRDWNKEFNRIFEQMLTDLGFSGPAIDDPSVRSKLDACVKDRKAIEDWRRGINDPKLLARYNHPATVLRHYKESKPNLFPRAQRMSTVDKLTIERDAEPGKLSEAKSQIDELEKQFNEIRLQRRDFALTLLPDPHSSLLP